MMCDTDTPQKAYDLRDAVFETFHELARADCNLLFLTADMGAWSLSEFRKELPGQFFNVGIAEQTMIGMAAGLAHSGKKVVVYAIAPFLALRCLEHIKIDLCLMNLPVTVIGGGAGVAYAGDGPTHYALDDLAGLMALPGLRIFNPADPVTAQSVARSAYWGGGPCYIRLDKGAFPPLVSPESISPTGFSTLAKGEGLLLIGTGTLSHELKSVCADLASMGIDTSLLDVWQLKPLPLTQLVELCRKSKAVAVVEEHVFAGSLAANLACALLEAGVNVTYLPLCAESSLAFKYGNRDFLRSLLGLDIKALPLKLSEWFRSAADQVGNIKRASAI